MIKVGEWVLTSAGNVVYNEVDGRYSFKSKKDAMAAVCADGDKVRGKKMPSGQYCFSLDGKSYTVTKVTENNMLRVMSMLDVN